MIKQHSEIICTYFLQNIADMFLKSTDITEYLICHKIREKKQFVTYCRPYLHRSPSEHVSELSKLTNPLIL